MATRLRRLPASPLVIKLAASAGFLADAYDLFVINIVTAILQAVYPTTGSWGESAVKSAVIIGTVLGQVVLGAAGDRVGRRAAFLTSMCICIAFSLLSGLAVRRVVADDGSVFALLALFRLALGFGIGGEYPLSATITAEAAATAATADGKSRALAMVFSMQGVGNCIAPACALVLLRTPLPLDAVWRAVLAFGALPFALTAPLRLQISDGAEYRTARKLMRPTREWAAEVWRLHAWPLLGTAGSWFLFDVVFYGNSLFQADFELLLGPPDAGTTRTGLIATARTNLLVSLLGLPGYWAAVACMRDDLRRQRAIQMCGFAACAAVYGFMAVHFDAVRRRPAVFVLMYGASFFFSNFGPNATTFVLPACYFPTKHRSVCHGLSAAAGKVGALVAASSFQPCVASFGPAMVFGACATISALGFLSTWLLIPTAPYAATGLESVGLDQPIASTAEIDELNGGAYDEAVGGDGPGDGSAHHRAGSPTIAVALFPAPELGAGPSPSHGALCAE